MPIIDTPAGTLEVQNAILSASEFRATQKIGVANSAPTKTFSVGDKLHVSTTDLDTVSISGNLVAQKVKVGNLLVSPTFDLASVSNVGNTTSNIIQFANATTGFTTTANVEIGGNITFTSNTQVKVGSNVLTEYTGPHPREPKEMPIKKYPEITFHASKLDGNYTTNTYTQAGYTVTSSTDNFHENGFFSYKLFNGIIGGDEGWISESDPATVSGSPFNSISSSYVGEWVKLELPKSIKLNHFTLSSRKGYQGQFQPVNYKLFGSINNSTWVELAEVTGQCFPSSDATVTTNVTTSNYYKYYALVVSKTRSSVVCISEWELYGSEEPAPVGDLSLDTTLKSTFNSVRSNNYVMYFDGDEFIPGDNNSNNLVTGSSVSVVHHNATYDSTGKYWTLNGSTESNVTTGDLGFEGDVPHTVSMWVNSSNLDANASTQQLFTIGSGYDKALVRVDDTQITANTWHNVTYAYQGEGGSKVTYINGRKVEEEKAEDTFGEYPPFEMTDYETGGYRVSASSDYTSDENSLRRVWNAYADGGAWMTEFDVFGRNASSNNNAAEVGEVTITDTDGASHIGHYTILETPFKLRTGYLTISATVDTRRPESVVILGSNNNENWDLLYTNTSVPDDNDNTLVVGSTKGYKYHMFMVKNLDPNGEGAMYITRIKYYGHKEGDLTRFPEPTKVLKYPRRAITTGHTAGDNTYMNRFDEVSTTSEFSTNGGTYSLVKAFDNIDGGNVTYWSASKRNSPSGNLGRYAHGAHGAYNGETPTGKSFIPSNATTAQKGEWIKMKSSHKLKLNKIELLALSTTHKLVPSGVLIWGSDDDSNWNLLKTHVPSGTGGAVTYSNRLGVITVNSTVAYKYHAMVMTHMNDSDSTYTLMSISQMRFYGTEEDTGTPAIVGGPFAGKVANFRVYDKYLDEERIQEIYDVQKDAFGHKKSSMTLYNGRIGVGTTEPEGALTVLDEPHNLEMFPAHELVSNDTHIDGQGIIKVSSSYRGESNRSLGANDHALRTDVHAYRAFMSDRNWISAPERNTRMSEEVDYGAWLKIQTPQSISLKKAKIESNPHWQQIGSETHGGSIDHTLTGEHFGRAVACSHDGTRVIVGYYVAPNSTGVGKVQVYDWNGSSWTRVGQILDGPGGAADDKFGHAVAISGDGNIIAVTAPFEHVGGDADKGTVRVYYLLQNTWTILPDSSSLTQSTGIVDVFAGETAEDRLGLGGVKLSYDGYTIAMGEVKDDTGVANIGRVRVFTYSNGAWSQKGSTLVGDYTEEEFGQGLDMSEDGNHLIIGTKFEGGTNQPPRVDVYRWTGSAWAQKGSSITYADIGDGFGPSVSISNDGNTIGIGIKNADAVEGAPDNTTSVNDTDDHTGVVYVYHWNGSAWGTPYHLVQPGAGDHDFGDHQVMSGDGKRLIVGASHADYSGGTNSGRLYTFEFRGDSWLRRPVPMVGADGGNNAYLGSGPSSAARSHAISRDGSVIVAGEFGFYTNGVAYAGRVRIYNMPSNIKSIWGSNDDVNWTKITTAPTREEATSNVAGFQFGYDDRVEIKNLDNSNYYKYHAIVADAYTTLKNVRLYGIREKASSTIHDGTLTLTKNLIVPRIGPAFDADDTPRRDRLVVEYTTSTNPVEYGYVKDTSGNGYNARMVGAVYNPSDKSFECSASDGTQWIETLIPNGSRFNTQFTVSFWANVGQFNLSSLYGFLFGLGDRNQTGLSSTSGNEISLVYNHAGNSEGTFFATIEGSDLFFKEWTTHDSHMGQWYHLTMTYDSGAATLYLYKNGENSGYATRTAPVLPDKNCVVRLFGDAVNENATHQGVQARISNFKLYDCYLTPDEVRTLYNMGRCDEGHHVVSFEKTRVGIGLGDSCAPKAELDVRGKARIGPSGQQWRTSGDDGDRLIQFHSGQAAQGSPTLEVTHYGGTRASPTPTVLQISNELGGGSDWSTTEPYALLSFATADGSGSGVAGPATSVGAVCDSGSGGGDTRLAFFTNSGINHIERMCVTHDGNVGIRVTNPGTRLTVGGEVNPIIRLQTTQAGDSWGTGSSNQFGKLQWYGYDYEMNQGQGAEMAGITVGTTDVYPGGMQMRFFVGAPTFSNGGWNLVYVGYLSTAVVNNITFTGQHRNFIDGIPATEYTDYEGLIVSANKNKYYDINKNVKTGVNAIQISQSLPLVSLSTKEKDKACFGVISGSEDPDTREYSQGSYVSVCEKQNGDRRAFINSVGEGAIWVTNINGPLESGDYITTSNVAGYGQKQDSDSLKNYTVAKITMDCDFEPVTQPVQIIKKEMGDVNYWVKTTYENVSEEEYSNLTDKNRRIVDGIYQKITKEESKTEQEGYELEVRQELVNVLDEHGQIQWEDDPTETEKAYKIRYLDADGNITDEANAVHIAAFVGCTYHCG